MQGSASSAFAAISPDPGTGLNAWEVVDSDPAYGTPGLITMPLFSNAVNNQMYARGFELTAIMRLLPGGTDGICLSWSDGFTLSDDRFLVRFQVSGNDVIAKDWGSANTFLCAGAMDGQHHAFAIRFVPGVGMRFVYDGVVMGSVNGIIPDPSYNFYSVVFGSYVSGSGSARINRVELRYWDDISTSYCSPAVPNSTGSPATLTALGSVFLAQNSVQLRVQNLPPGQFAFCLNSMGSGLVMNPGGSQGNLCLGGGQAIGRHNRPGEFGMASAGGEFAVDLDWNDLPGPLGTQTVAAGSTWNFQCWYRDMNPSSTSNFSNALGILPR